MLLDKGLRGEGYGGVTIPLKTNFVGETVILLANSMIYH